MRIWLIRHGKTPLNEAGRYQGKLDTGLSEEGQRALRRADASPSRVYVSPALRARQTAEILFPEANKVIVEDLREMDFGTFDGRGWWEMEDDADYRSWVDGGCLGQCPGGEDRASCSARVCDAFARILDGTFRDCGTDDLFIVAHGGTQMAVLEKWGQPARDYYAWQTPCGCGWCLETAPQPGVPGEWKKEGLRAAGQRSFLREGDATADR